MKKYPKILNIKTLRDKKLEVIFEGNIKKIYDCNPLLSEESFQPLKDDIFFQNAHADEGGYGVIWNENIDLSESELWENGITI